MSLPIGIPDDLYLALVKSVEYNKVLPDVGTTVITKIELLRERFDFVLKAATGAEFLRVQKLLVRTEELLAQIVVVSLDETTAVQFDRLRAIK